MNGWYATEEKKAAYTNLPAGDYVFEVKSVYPDGTDSVVNTLAIRILPHWSQTIWFRLCVLFGYIVDNRLCRSPCSP